MHLAMIGTGYVGLVSGTCFAEFGWDVVCVDMNVDKIAKLERGEMPIFEPGLDEMVARNVAAGRLRFTTDLASTVKDADAVFIAVGTPPRPEDGHADLQYVIGAAREIASAASGYTVVVTKSTVPVGTGAMVEDVIRETRSNIDVDVVSNPEFLREGAAIEDFMNPDRVVIGTESPRARDLMARLYQSVEERGAKIVFTARPTSELIKYSANAFLATKITFINEIADLCEVVGANVLDVAYGLGLDDRIGAKFLQPGPGYGGSCFPKDTLELVATARKSDAPVRIVEAVVAVNDDRKRRMADKVIAAAGGSVAGLTIAILGLTFKANTDDMRDAPSLSIIPSLQRADARLRVYDPEGMAHAREMIDDVEWCGDAFEAMRGADLAVILTEWAEFRELEPARIAKTLTTPLLVDLRNLFDPDVMAHAGIRYVSVGRAPSGPSSNDLSPSESRMAANG